MAALNQLPMREFPFEIPDKTKFEYFKKIPPSIILSETVLTFLEYSIKFNLQPERRLDLLESFLSPSMNLQEFTLEEINKLRLDIRNLEKIETACEDMLNLTASEYKGHPLYGIFANTIRLNFNVIQKLNPSEVVNFDHSSENPCLYVYEANEEYMILFPKRKYYKQIWLNKEDMKCEHCDYSKDDLKREVCNCLLCDNCAYHVKISGTCCVCSLPVKHKNSSKSKHLLKSHLNEVLEAIKALESYQTTLISKISISIEKQKNVLLDYGQKLQKIIKHIEKSPRILKMIKKNKPKLVLQTNELAVDEIIHLHLPLLNFFPSNKECYSCSNANNNISMACGCHLCKKCLIERIKSKQKYCENCRNPFPYRESISSLKSTATAKLKKMGDSFCINCGSEPDLELMVNLSCNCRICFNCAAEIQTHCVSCAAELSNEDNKKLPVFFQYVGDLEKCQHCQNLKILVCKCSCRTCAVKNSTPDSPHCLVCNSSFSPEFLRNIKQKCNLCLKHNKLVKMPCKCRICPNCLVFKQYQADLAKCLHCDRTYTSQEKEAVERIISKFVKCKSCGRKDQMACNCTCLHCLNGKAMCDTCRCIYPSDRKKNKK